MNSLTVAIVLWNGLLLVTLVALIRRRTQVMRWVKGLDDHDRSAWEHDPRGNGQLVPVWNLNPAKNGLVGVSNVDKTSTINTPTVFSGFGGVS